MARKILAKTVIANVIRSTVNDVTIAQSKKTSEVVVKKLKQEGYDLAPAPARKAGSGSRF